jgi:hypothetical protein
MLSFEILSSMALGASAEISKKIGRPAAVSGQAGPENGQRPRRAAGWRR